MKGGKICSMKILEIDNIYYEVENKNILNGISFNIKEGDCISIIGASGSGKSTLLKICADLLPFSSGDIRYKNKSYLNYNPLELRHKISYSVQIPYLFGKKVRENLEFPFKIRNEKVDENKIISLLNRFNLDESIINKDTSSLSGGEKQRVAIIRSILYTPDILLLDEVTSALDKENSKNVEEYIRELNENGVTVMWVTHNNKQSEGIFNKRVVMSKGKIEKVEVLK